MEQGSEAWFTARQGRFSASVCGALLGLSSFGSAASARRDWINENHGQRRDFDSPDMARGRRLEPIAIEMYEDEKDVTVFSDPGRAFEDWLWASPDGLVDDGMVETKAPRRFHDEPYPQYLVQMLVQLYVYERNWIDFVQIVEVDGVFEIRTMRFTRDELQALYPTALTDLCTLWMQLVEAPLPEPAKNRADREWLEAESEYTEAKIAADRGKVWSDTARDVLLGLAQGKPCLGVEWQVVEATRTGSVDLKKLAKDHPEIDLDTYRKAATTSLSVRATAKGET